MPSPVLSDLPVVLAQTTTGVPVPTSLRPAFGDEGNGIGGVVFAVTVAIILAGVVVLVVRNRGRGTNARRAPDAPDTTGR